MVKADRKSPNEAFSLFHNIMKASVKGNPKTKKKDADKSKKKQGMPVYILSVLLILTGVYFLMLGVRKKTSTENIQDLHVPMMASNYKVRYRVLGVIFILLGLIVLLK